MDERLKESISALVDDEANELEIQRVLSNLEDDVIETWQSYHSIRDSLRSDDPALPKIDIRQSLADKLDYELDHSDDVSGFDDALPEQSVSMQTSSVETVTNEKVAKSINGRRAVKRRLTRGPIFGVAASALFALVLATQYQGVSQNTAQPGLASSDNGSLTVSPDTLYAQAPEATAVPVAVRQPKIIDQFSEEHAKQFNKYLLRHAENSVYGFSQGVMPLARVASVNSVGL